MRYADIKKASEEERQNQTTKQTIITSKNLCPFMCNLRKKKNN